MATRLMIKPSKNALISSYGLIGATLASGLLLVLLSPSALLQACVSGVLYTVAISVMTYAAQTKLVRKH